MIRTQSQVLDLQIVLLEVLAERGRSSDGSTALDDVTSAELAIPTPTHQIQVAIDSDKACMAATADDSRDFFIQDDLLWSVQTLLLVMAELTVLPVAPSVRVTPPIDIGRVLVSTREVYNLALRSRRSDLLRIGLFQGVRLDP